jgi:selenocysteine lyase/cysteine desulfurase
VAAQLNLHTISVRKPAIHPIGKVWNESVLSAIDDNTVLVVLPHVHWIEGIIFDLEKIGVKCREHGALLIIDGTQSVGALPFDTEKVKPDAVICGAYKWLLGPYSLGMAYFGEFFDDGVPIEETWMNRLKSNDFTNLTNLQNAYRPMAQRYNMGEFSQFIQLPMLVESLKLLLAWGVKNIQGYTQSLTKEPIQSLRELGCQIEDSACRAGHLFSVKLPATVAMEKLSEALAANKVYVSKRGEGLRISANVFNDSTDFEALIRAIESTNRT